ncbi:patatin-like phospholipase domain-containing protein 7 isoform X1 [Pocillopora damicornis]|uniref:patatin-like phospholipase domain-containing protein 7 isoform X1 n=1 Tax=Pocillopora damicornis TaxID=46731 RepID=UPI000F54F969|nr:patatin-like phospholipase domain-containing protein 7 isoform X1 [Pocillopora damicornis]
MDAIRMATTSMVEKFREIQLFPEVSVNLVIGIVFITAVIIAVYCIKTYRRRVEVPNEVPMNQEPRFRKRDKMIFYGKKYLRKVKQLSQPQDGGYRRTIRKRQKVMFNFGKELLRFDNNEPGRQLKQPPAAFLEADLAEVDINEPRLPPEVVYMLKSVRVFGHFEKPLFFELCKYIQTKLVPANALLFKPGQHDDSIYVVQSGKLSVSIIEKDGTEVCMKEVLTGESIYSVLTILDVLTGHHMTLPQICCRAVVDTHVLRLPGKAFQTVFEQHPDSLVRVVQIIMLRLQQVTFMALHNFLGLSYELIASSPASRRRPSIYGITSSPVKGKTTETPAGKENQTKTTKKIPLEVDSGASSAASSKTTTPDSVVGYPKEKENKEPRGILGKENSKPIPVKKVPLHRSVSFTEPEHERKVDKQIGRCKSAATLETMLGFGSDSDLSDFDAALGRARLTGFPESPSRTAMFDLEASDTEGSPSSSLEGRFDFPATPVTEDLSKQFLTMDPEEEDKMMKTAASEIAKSLDLPDSSLLEGLLSVACIPSGTVLIKQGDVDCSLYFVVTNSLEVTQKSLSGDQEYHLYTALPGEFVGVLAVVTGEPSFFNVKATKQCHVVIISKANFYIVIRHKPRVILNVAHSLIGHLSPFLRQIDYALDWMHVEAGRAVYRQGEQSNCIYIVLNGRLRSVVTSSNGKKELDREAGRGELVGVVEVLTQAPRATTVHAIRDTELAVLPDGLLNTIKRHFPQVVTRLIHLLGERLLGQYRRSYARSETLLENHLPVDNQIFGGSNLGTVAIIPASEDVPVSNFSFELSLALHTIGPTLLLTSSLVRSRLGSSAMDSMNEYRLSSWLGQQEDLHRIVLYQADTFMSAWTKRCIRQADSIVIVGVADGSPAVGQLEKQLENIGVRSQKELILLHREDGAKGFRISHTVDWLNARGWICAHHHVRCAKKIFGRRPLSERYAQNPAAYPLPERNSDFSRLARRLTGTSIGLILGGGGARGLSHVGVIKALEEAGIPIDMVGGTSMGSFVGATYAETADVNRMCQKVREWSMDMTSLFKKILDLTYPFTSMFSGSGFNASIRSSFGERQIEDLLLPYFCITTDITSSRMRVHTDGCLWRYVRASMSLSGYLPPLCDPKDGHLLLDGGYVNNLPADVMKTMGAQTIIAIDVGSEDPDDLTNYGDQLSGWWLLWNKWNPFAETVKIPDMAEIQSRLAYVSCVRQLAEVKESSYCEYIRPPIDRFKTLEFGRFDEIVDVGYHHGKTVFKGWVRGNKLPDIFREHPSRSHMTHAYATGQPVGKASEHSTFTNLAEQISRIEPPYTHEWLPFSSSDELLGSSSPPGHHMYSASEEDDEYDEEEENLVRVRPRTGSLSEHEDLLALKTAQFQVVRREEAGYDSDDTHVRRRLGLHHQPNSEP